MRNQEIDTVNEAITHQAIAKAIDLAGGLGALANLLKIRYQSIQDWIRIGRVPAERVLQIEQATKGQVTRHELRPDIYPQDEAINAR